MSAEFRRPLFFTRPMLRGDDVLQLQMRLARTQSGVLGQPDGVFGKRTAEAVTNFQKIAGLAVDGIVGVRTWSRLFEQPLAAAVTSANGLEKIVEALQQPHRVFSDSVSWHLTAKGVVVEEQAPAATAGGKALARQITTSFAEPLARWAVDFDVPVELIVATIATESSGNPAALRKEPGYESDERTPGRISVGLMQTLISTAAGALGRPMSRAALLQPAVSIEAGTAYIGQQRRHSGFDPPVVACAYNAGSVRHQAGPNNRWKMRQFPIGTAKHADRFVQHFNDLFAFFEESGVPFAEAVPSFYRVLKTGF